VGTRVSVNNDRFLSAVYSAADLFAICSLHDNLPNTVLEAMACGVPVGGYAVGGISDMVRNGVNGLTVTATDVDPLPWQSPMCSTPRPDVRRWARTPDVSPSKNTRSIYRLNAMLRSMRLLRMEQGGRGLKRSECD